MVDETIFGEMFSDGKGIKRNVIDCAVTGERIVAGDAMVKVEGTPYFFRVKAQIINRMKPEQIAEIKAKVAPALSIKTTSADTAPLDDAPKGKGK